MAVVNRKHFRAVVFSKLPFLLALWMIFAIVTEQTQVTDTSDLDVMIENTVVSFRHYNYNIQLSSTSSDQAQVNIQMSADLEVITNRIHEFFFFLDESYHIIIKKLKVDGRVVRYDYQGSICRVELPFSCFIGKKLLLEMEYDLQSVVSSEQVFAELRGDWYPKNLLPELVTANFRLVVPAGVIGIANGHFQKVIHLSNNRTVYEWQMTRLSSSLGVSLGNYLLLTKTVDNKPYRLYSVPGYSEQYCQEILDWAITISQYYQTEFSAEDFNGLSIVINDTECEESSFGSLLFLHLPNTHTDSALRFGLAHEIAHYWWGNLIIPKTIYDWWLVEGFANYSAWLAIERFEQNSSTQSSENEKIINNWRSQYRNTLVSLQRYQAPEMSLAELTPFDAQREILYSKGALVLHMTREMLGEASFQYYISEFVRRFSLKRAGIRDFTSLGIELFGAEWMDFFRQWVYSAGYYDLALRDVTVTKKDNHYLLKARIDNIGQLNLPSRVIMEIITKEQVLVEVLHFKGVNVTIQKTLLEKPLEIKVNYHSYIPETSLSDNLWRAENILEKP